MKNFGRKLYHRRTFHPLLRNGFAAVLSFVSLEAAAQADNEWMQSILTEYAAQNDEEQDAEQLFEILETLSENPVRINSADRNELTRLFWLTEFQIMSLLDHVKTKGPILSLYEMAYLYGFTPETAQNMAPFVSLEIKPEREKPKPSEILRKGAHRLVVGGQSGLQQQEGYARPDSMSHYAGSPVKTSLRYSFYYSDRVHFGVTAEKDAGESFFRGNNPYGYDFYSAHLQIKTQNLLKMLILGDYRADFGQGLTLWSGMKLGKISMLMNAVRYNQSLRYHCSVDENRFFRGAGATFDLKFLEATLFYSCKDIDASISEKDENGKALSASTFPYTGYHRTPTEIAQKDAAKEQIAGINLSFTRTDWHIGATADCYAYSLALVPPPNAYNRFDFSGKSGGNYSFDFRVRLGNAVFYGEQAWNGNGAAGGVYGSQMLIGEHLTANLFYRHYAKNFHSRYGNAFGENARNSNEEGFFLGWNLNLSGKWMLASYWDIFRFPWMRYRTHAPSFGQDIFWQTDYTPSYSTKFYLRLRYREKEENAAQAQVNTTVPVKTQTAKLVFSHQITETVGIGNHLEIKNYRKANATSAGYFLSQDIRAGIQLSGHALQLTFRFALFDTDDYDSRIYAYENDMLYTLSIPAFSDRGMRLYLMSKYSIGQRLDVRLRYASTHYTDRNTIGSGLNEIQGNKASEIKAQVIFKF
ncbi:MAG: hypothetical protein LBF89_11705 [Bacteroidales bacterium]|nr:hypothetical protein [Bacteroidales bacterium]